MNKKPNVVLINCDDMGYGDLGCYGSELNSTPTIDRLASEGVKLTSFYAASPVCSPSRASLLTGCYPPRVSMNSVLFPGDSEGLNPEEYTIGNLFKDNGYATKIVGKWHVGDQKAFLPQKFGFDEYYGLPYSNDMGIQEGNSWRTMPPLPLIEGSEVIEEQPDQRSLTARYTEHCKRFIREHSNEPFFLYMAHMHMHLPHYCAEPFMKDSRNGDFGGCIKEVDWSVESIIHELKIRGIYDNTIIIFTSDNGSRCDRGGSNGNLRGTKFTTFEGGQRVPCIVKWDDHIKPGTVSDDIGSQIDLLPTLAGMIGGTKNAANPIDGIDIIKQLCDGIKVRDTFIYTGQTPLDENLGVVCAVRKDRWKLHVKSVAGYSGDYDTVMELYDLNADVNESNNLYESHKDVVDELSQIIENYELAFGNKSIGSAGEEVRVCGHVEDPVCLTEYDEDHPYITAMYDKDDRG